jgi:hypothetical protein
VIPSTSLHSPTREKRKTATSWQHNQRRHRPLHDAGDALLSRDPMTTATSGQHDHRRHHPLHDPGDDPGDGPGDPLLRGDPAPAAVKPQSRRLRFLRVYQHDTRGGARSWRHHRSARGRYTMLWMKKE